MEGRSKPEAVSVHGGASQASPQLGGMRVKPMPAGITTPLLKRSTPWQSGPCAQGLGWRCWKLPAVYIKGGALLHAGRHRGKQEDIGESIREKGIAQSESS